MYDCSKFLLRLWQCLLIIPVTRTPDGAVGDDAYAFSGWRYAFNLVALAACLATGLWALLDDLQSAKTGRSLRMQTTSAAVVTFLQVLLMAMVCVLAVACSAGRHRTMLEIGRQLKHVDAVLEVPAVRPLDWFAPVLVGVHAALFALDGHSWYALSPFNWAYCVCYVYQLIDLAAMLLYAQTAWSIGHRFEKINAEIERKLAGQQNDYGCSGGGGRPLSRVRFAGIGAVNTAAVAALEPAVLVDKNCISEYRTLSEERNKRIGAVGWTLGGGTPSL